MTAPVKLKVKRLSNCKDLPRYATAGAAGMDLTAGIDAPLTLEPGCRIGVPTGLVLEIPLGYEAQVRPRSGLAAKAGITLTNCVGTIDSDYRGEVVVLAINLGEQPYTFQPGERIAQMVIAPVLQVEIEEVAQTSESERGAGGFGSTGKSMLAAAQS